MASATMGPRARAEKLRFGNLYTGAARQKLDPALLVASRARGYLQVVGNVGVFTVVLVIAGHATAPWQMLLLFMASGLALHRLFFPTHDCIHHSLFPTKSENRVCGVFLSALLGTSFDAIRDQHLEHHRDFGSPDDPGAADYFVKFRSRGQFLAFVLGPLVGSILWVKLGDYLRRPSETPASDAPPSRVSKTTKLGTKLRGYGAILTVQAGVCALVTSGFQLHQLWRYPVFNVLPAVTIFLFLVRLRMFLEHGPLDYAICDYFENRRPTARTIYASWPERLLLCGSDFNYHHEHHLYPIAPGWQLPRLHRVLQTSGLDPEDVRQSYLQAFREIWRNLPATELTASPAGLFASGPSQPESEMGAGS
jgi:fatty acid desaturase